MEQTILPFMPSANIWSITQVSDARRPSSYCSLSRSIQSISIFNLKTSRQAPGIFGETGASAIFVSQHVSYIYEQEKKFQTGGLSIILRWCKMNLNVGISNRLGLLRPHWSRIPYRSVLIGKKLKLFPFRRKYATLMKIFDNNFSFQVKNNEDSTASSQQLLSKIQK